MQDTEVQDTHNSEISWSFVSQLSWFSHCRKSGCPVLVRGLVPMSPTHQPLLLELLEDRYQRGSVLVTSQLPIKLWHGQFQDPTLADAILDRLVHNAESIELTGESMRKRNPPPAHPASNKLEPAV